MKCRPAELRAAAVNAVAARVTEATGSVARACRGRTRVGRVAAGVGQRSRNRISVAGQRRRPTPTAVTAGRNVARLLRGIAAIAEVVVGRAVGGRPVIGRDIRSVASEVATHRPGLGGEGADQDHGSEGEFGQSFHNCCYVVYSWRRFVLNCLHLLHRKRRRASYKFFEPRITQMNTEVIHRKTTRKTQSDTYPKPSPPAPCYSPRTPHPTCGHVDSLAPDSFGLSAFAGANSSHRFPNGSSLPIRCGEGDSVG